MRAKGKVVGGHIRGMEGSVGSVPVGEAMNKMPKEITDRERRLNKKLLLIQGRWDLANAPASCDGGSPRKMEISTLKQWNTLEYAQKLSTSPEAPEIDIRVGREFWEQPSSLSTFDRRKFD
jgi:hypothetical protein